MAEFPHPMRKRDKLRNWRGLGRSNSRINSQIPSFEDSNESPVCIATPPSSPAHPAPHLPPSAESTLPTPAASTSSRAAILPIISLPFTPTPRAQGLWLDALQKLSEVDQRAIRSIEVAQDNHQLLPERIEDLVIMTKEKQLECEKGFYKFCFQGKELILRDVAGRIVFWLNKFKEVGDIVVNFDPVHASLPWAGVRFLLQVAVGNHEQMGAVLVSIERVTYLINRCTIYEGLYRSGTTPGSVLYNFQTALIELYAAILRLLALANRLLSKNAITQALHALINFGEISDLLTKCQDLETRVETEANNCERMRSQEADAKTQQLLKSLRIPVLRTDDRVCSLLETVDEEERLKIIDWISTVLYGMNHNNVKDQRTKGTGEWLLSHSYYIEWQDTSSSMILWLRGNAGTGKTYLTSRAIDQIRDTLESNPNHEGLAFFYCNRNEIDRQEPLSVLRSFVRQLSTIIKDDKSIQKRLRQYYIQARIKASQPTISDCRELLLEFINIYPKTTLILDALDECDKQQRFVLLDIFDDLVAHASNPVKIFISSRPDIDIRERFKSKTNIEIQAKDNHDDISKFVRSEITKHSRWKKFSPELQSEVIETLQQKSQGMFQWAYLQIKQLSVLKEKKEIQDRLGALPNDLKEAYDEIYYGMDRREREILDRAFRWVMCCRERLTTDLLLQAVCQNEDDDTVKFIDDLDEDLLLEYCHNLLVVDTERRIWVPSHLSVIEYFENHLWSQNEANLLVSSVCLLVLNDTTHWDLSLYSLRFYARHYWMLHVQECEPEGSKDRLSTLLKRFLGSPTVSSPAYQLWHRVMKNCFSTKSLTPITRRFGSSYSFLEPASSAAFAICAFGFYTSLSDWWDNPWTEYVQKNSGGLSLLQLAAVAGSVSICGRLVEWGVDIHEQFPGGKYGSTLAAAAYWGNKEVVELLIKSGADINALLQVGNFSTTLAAAAYEGHKEVVKLLIESGADVNALLQVGNFGSILAAAAYEGHKEVVELLIKSGADMNAQLQFGEYGSALAAAAYGGNMEVVELLIEAGADTNALPQFGYFGSALAAAAWGEKKVVELLIKSGADVNALLQVGNYGSALAVAVYWGNKEVVGLLIKSGADVNSQLQIGPYGSALAVAAYRASEDMVEQLIKSGANVNAQLQFGNYGSALTAAACGGRMGIAESLIRSGADVNAQLQFGRFGSALAAAKESPHSFITQKMVELLIKSGAKYDVEL